MHLHTGKFDGAATSSQCSKHFQTVAWLLHYLERAWGLEVPAREFVTRRAALNNK